MLEKLLYWDKQLFIFLNGWGNESMDGFWLFVTKQTHWIPLFALFAYLVFKHLDWKKALLVLGFVAVLIAFTDQSTNLIKDYVQRLRPCCTPGLQDMIRIVQKRDSYSFFSGHAAGSMAASIFLFRLLRPYVKFMWLIFLWPLVYAYSRIYLGLHFPSDILCGYLWGVITSALVFALYRYTRDRIFPPSDDAAHGQPVADRQ